MRTQDNKIQYKFLAALFLVLLNTVNVYAENPDALLSKNDAKQMFELSRLAWEKNVRQLKSEGVGDFKITPAGEFTLFIRSTPGTQLLIMTPSYEASRDDAPWKLSVAIAAVEEPALSLYRSMSPDIVKNLVQTAAREMMPEYSVMGYMARNPKTSRAPSFHFTIFREGDFPTIDRLVKTGKICPPVSGKQVCVRSSMIE